MGEGGHWLSGDTRAAPDLCARAACIFVAVRVCPPPPPPLGEGGGGGSCERTLPPPLLPLLPQLFFAGRVPTVFSVLPAVVGRLLRWSLSPPAPRPGSLLQFVVRPRLPRAMAVVATFLGARVVYAARVIGEACRLRAALDAIGARRPFGRRARCAPEGGGRVKAAATRVRAQYK